MSKKCLAMILAVTMLTAVTGCSGSAQKTAATQQKQTETTTQTPQEETEEEKSPEDQLLDAYIVVNNAMVGAVQESIDRYFSGVKEQETFEVSDTDYSCYNLEYVVSKIEDANKLASARKDKDKDKLDEAFTALYPVLTQLINELNDIYTYSNAKAYLQDNYEKGKEQHAAFWKTYQEYKPLKDEFVAQITEAGNAQNEKYVKELDEKGFKTLSALNRLLDQMMYIQDEVDAEKITDENLLELDLDKIKPLYDEYVAKIDELMKASQEDTKLEEENISLESGEWKNFISNMNDAKTSLEGIMKHVENQEPISETDLAATSITGLSTLSSFNIAARKMVDIYNQIDN